MRDTFLKSLVFWVLGFLVLWPAFVKAANPQAATDAFGNAYEQAYERLRLLGKNAPVEEKQRAIQESLKPYHQAQDGFNRENSTKKKPRLNELGLSKPGSPKLAEKKTVVQILAKEREPARAPSGFTTTRVGSDNGDSSAASSGINSGGAEAVDFNAP